jgi:putative endonuclease
MSLFARAMFGVLDWLARRGGLREPEEGASGLGASVPEPGVRPTQLNASRIGIRGETYAYWFLRNQGYTIVRRNYRLSGIPGEIDLIGWDGPVLAFVEVKTRTGAHAQAPEEAISQEKRRHLLRMAKQFLGRQRRRDVPSRFDVVAIQESAPGKIEVRLHKDAFGDSRR